MIYESDFLDLYGDDYYDLIVLDEFKGQKSLTFLNSFIDGTPKHYNVKFGAVQKFKNLPVIFFSNLPPTDVYKKAQDITLDAFIDRIDIVTVDTLYNICDYFKMLSELPNENVEPLAELPPNPV